MVSRETVKEMKSTVIGKKTIFNQIAGPLSFFFFPKKRIMNNWPKDHLFGALVMLIKRSYLP